ncbi:SSI family serine proteinase inhibitor [Glycomyces tritici]|uniref:SSI family serine proteinase inhibitor n=1 Tax=Glycomyces tritici TaxID=2665176 RepID=A0ABT7YHU4_9ACTN|nr:SSI family serine proteinase inhibitor [Glycomyces tritici]MDN3238209.1 SSI family serine proteinase inhibitor [Glycomyces tritici]
MRKLIVGAFAAAAFVAAGSGPVQAALLPYEPIPVDPGIGDGSGPHSAFEISVAAANGEADAITLSCPQEWSEHPNAAAVCDQLKEARGLINAIAPADGMCTKEYAPVLVVVSGHWHQTNQFFMKEYSNRCEAVLATGGSLLDF